MNASAKPDILQQIIAHKHQEIASRRAAHSLVALHEQVQSIGEPRGFVDRIQRKIAAGQAAVIAEIKKASPSKGLLRADFDPPAIAQSYQAGGAACLSVLTDEHFFQGSDADLQSARASSQLPVIRKDFMVDRYQIYEARWLGADCVLLIVAALDDSALMDLYECARSLNLDVLVEVHDHAELVRARALPLSAAHAMIGINNRNLRTFEVNLNTTLELCTALPAGILAVTESGILKREDVQTMRASGVHAFLVGEAFMRAEDPGASLQALFF